MDTLRLSILVCVSTAGCVGLANLYNRANSSEWSSHTDGTKYPTCVRTKKSQGRGETIPTWEIKILHVGTK